MISLETAKIQLLFDDNGVLTSFVNKSAGMKHSCRWDGFAISAVGRELTPADFPERCVRYDPSALEVTYNGRYGRIVCRWVVTEGAHFARFFMDFTAAEDMQLQTVKVCELKFEPDREEIVLSEYRYIDFAVFDEMPNHQIWNCYRDQDTEPSRLCFGRGKQGGFFTGLEAVFDISRIGAEDVVMTIRPMMHLKCGETLNCEPAFIGVYVNTPYTVRWQEEWQKAVDRGVFSVDYFKGGVLNSELVQLSGAGGSATPNPWKQPLESRPTMAESIAVTAMVQEIFGKPRFGIMANACGWHCDMCQDEYTPESAEKDKKALAVFRECGLDGVFDPHPWGGDISRMNSLREGDHYVPGELTTGVIQEAEKQSLKFGFWPTINKTHPWRPVGIPFRPDRPEWERKLIFCENPNPLFENFRNAAGNCLGAYGFAEWLCGIYQDALDTGYYSAFILDGDFWGTGAYSSTTIPVECAAVDHKHINKDAEYVCRSEIQKIIARMRELYPDIYIFQCRPQMDHGIWALKNSDACFTLIEAGSGDDNIAAGDAIRMSARIRMHQHFFPHWLDCSLLYPSHYHPEIHPKWPHENMEYVLLSSIACTTNLLFYLPTIHDDFPAGDRAKIKYWLDWARANVDCLQVRKDFPVWPGGGMADGYAHINGDHGFVFWFNSTSEPCRVVFTLNEEECGFTADRATVKQIYPVAGAETSAVNGEVIPCDIPSQSAVILEIKGR